MISTPPASAKITSLEGLRGLMSMWVLLGHLSLAFGWNLALLDRNTLAVDVFIMLSGFVIARLLQRRQEPYVPYIVRRGFRLFPLYLVCLAIAVLALPIQAEAWRAVLSLSPHNEARLVLASEGIAHLPAHLLAHLALAHGAIPDALLHEAPFTLLGQAWSISLEWQFYLVAPVLLASLTRPGKAWIGALLVLALVLPSSQMTNAWLGNRIELFLAGMASALAFEQRHHARRWLAVAAACAVIAVARQGLGQLVPVTLWFGVIATVALPHMPGLRLADRILSAPACAHLGEISYSIYLIHTLPLFFGIWASHRLGFGPVAGQAFVSVLTVVGTLLLAEASWRWLEKPAMSFGSRIANRRVPAAAV
jgi:peptidoglycan/LPS O-acetylase OafA/YrhL